MSTKFGGYTVAGVKQKKQKNWSMQIVLTVALIGFPLASAFGYRHHGVVGIVLGSAGIVCILAVVGLALRALRTWDY
jgi:hypothetical protein